MVWTVFVNLLKAILDSQALRNEFSLAFDEVYIDGESCTHKTVFVLRPLTHQ